LPWIDGDFLIPAPADYRHAADEREKGGKGCGVRKPDHGQVALGVNVPHRRRRARPAAAVTDPIFKPVSEGGLGAQKEPFFDRYFKPLTLDHYPERDTPTGWCVGGIRRPEGCS
jgi:hypothetical protein